MAQWLNRGATAQNRANNDRDVRAKVEKILADIETRGDAAVRELSVRFDAWDRESYRLEPHEIQECIDQLTGQDLKDIEFAETQVRNFAQIQRDSMRDVEVETLPGVVLGHKHLPLNAAGCYVPGGKYPLLASAHMSVITAKVAGVPRVVTCAPPFNGRPAPAIVAAQAMTGTRFTVSAEFRRSARWVSAPSRSPRSTSLARPSMGPTRPRSCLPPRARWPRTRSARLSGC